jgi:hypothetical protein
MKRREYLAQIGTAGKLALSMDIAGCPGNNDSTSGDGDTATANQST